MSNRHKPVEKRDSDRASRPARKTLPYSDVPADESSLARLRSDVPVDEDDQGVLRHASDIRTRVTPRDRPRITQVSQPNPTFAYRPTEPKMEKVEPTEGARVTGEGDSAPDTNEPPSSAHMRAAASRRPRDLPPLVQDTHYRFVANRPRDSERGSKDS